jgi:hypothetical protein
MKKLIKIVRHVRYMTFQLAEVAIPRTLFREILRRIERLKQRFEESTEPAPAAPAADAVGGRSALVQGQPG